MEVSQETNRILVLEEAVAGLLRRARTLEARIAELEKRNIKTDQMKGMNEPAPAVRKQTPDRITSRPYIWAELGKAGKPCP